MARLTRHQQDAILAPVVLAARCMLAEPFADLWAPEHTLSSFRAELRLDDPELDAIIARKESSGQPWCPWQSATYKTREAV